MLRGRPPYRGGLCARDGVMIITEGELGRAHYKSGNSNHGVGVVYSNIVLATYFFAYSVI